MKIGTRVVFTLFLLVVLALCAGVLVTTLGLVEYAAVEPIVNAFTDPVGRYACAGVAAVLFVVGVCLMFFGGKKAEPMQVTLRTDANGSVVLTVKAIEELAMRCLTEVSGILVERIAIQPAVGTANVKITVRFSVKAGVKMPNLSETIRTKLAEYIKQYSGVTADVIDLCIVPFKAPTYPTK